MFKPHFGTCICHNKQRLIVVKKGYCSEGNAKLKGKTKVRPSFSELKTQLKYKPKKPTGELELFKKIWNERPHICQCTGRLIRRFNVSCFSHILPKGLYGKYRLLEENIWLVSEDVHHLWETTDRSQDIFIEKKKKYEELKQRYNGN